jgi:hypothetical protein
VASAKSRKFQFQSTTYRVVIDEKTTARLRLDEAVESFFENVIRQVREQALGGANAQPLHPSDLVRFSFTHPALNSPINLPFTPADQLSAERITAVIAKTMQSKEEFCIDNQVEVNVIVQPSFAGGRRHQHVQFSTIEEKIAAKRCVVQIQNRDTICMARALVVTKGKVDGDPAYHDLCRPDMRYELGRRQNVTEHRRNLQRNRALALCTEARVSRSGPHNIADMAKFQAYLGDYRIIAIEATNDRIIFDGGFQRGSTKVLGLLHHNGHYHALNNVGAWFEGKYFCYGCCRRYEKQGQHSCRITCPRCLGTAHGNVEHQALLIRCDECQLSYFTRECYDNHLLPAKSIKLPSATTAGPCTSNAETAAHTPRKRKSKTPLGQGAEAKSVCAMKRICKSCNQYFNGYEYFTYGHNHECGKHRCFNCKQMVVLDTHLCYMQQREKGCPIGNDFAEENNVNDQEDALEGDAAAAAQNKKRKRNSNENAGPHKFIFWDAEAQQEDGVHRPNLFIAHITCEVCIDAPDTNAFQQCKQHQGTFTCTTTTEFGRFIISQRNATFVAHNFKGYDSQFVLDYCRCNGITPEVIMNGSKCTYLKLPIQKLRFIDSLNFLPMALSKFPETFGFEELRKGYFPHFFNTTANANYIGPLPPKEDYGYNHMKPEQKIEFDRWYDAEIASGTQFNMQRDLQSYCENDVVVLRMGCTRFRRLLLGIAGTDPFKESVTIASCAQLIYRKLFLRPNTIGVLPPSGYRPHANQSRKALLWLSWLKQKEGIDIRDTRHPDGEFKINNYRVDGYCAASNTVYEFLGSYWHGDPNAYDPNTFNRRMQCPMGVLCDRTLRRQHDIEHAGYKYVGMWESEWDLLVKRDPELRRFTETGDATMPLDPRDAFFGGRTNASRLYYTQQDGSKVHYVDFCSLYPTVNKYCEYPIGHPEIIVDPPNGIDKYFGIAKCMVLPPRNLFHPVLPYRHPDGKLMFPLCIRCADTYQQTTCTHTEAERYWTGSWSTIELQHATSRGYKILKVFEVWHFENTTTYNRNEPGSGLFADYVNTFIKIKQEASGKPPNVTTPEELAAYIAEFEEREGVRMEESKIELNPGLRYMAKLFLNSLWGKFGQRSNLPRTVFVKTLSELNELLLRSDIEVSDLLEFKGPTIDDDICQVQFKAKNDFADELPSTNIFIAVFTTAHARLKLLREMEKLDRRVLYYDTDSIIYESRNGDPEPPTGSFLGDLTHELKPGDSIVEFFSAGPKNYGYRTASGKVVQKHKGITLTAKVLSHLTFDKAKQMVLQHSDRGVEPLFVELQQIRRDKGATALRTVALRKKYQFLYDKRVVCDNFYTLPYGHADI